MREIAANLFIETAFAGVNVGLIRAPNGLVGLDLPTRRQDVEEWAYRIRRLDRAPLRFIILSDAHLDRILAGGWFNAPIISHEATAVQIASYLKRPSSTLLERLDGIVAAEEALLKPQICFTNQMSLLMEGASIEIQHLPGPWAGNLVVRLPQMGALFCGDLVINQDETPIPRFPETNIEQWRDNLNRLIDSLQPTDKLLPGRGEPGDKTTAVAFALRLAQLAAADKEL